VHSDGLLLADPSVLSPEAAAEAHAATLAIAREVYDFVLDPSLGPQKVVDLAHGKAGRAVFYHYLSRATNDHSFAARSSELMEEALEALGATSLLPSLLYGFTGIAWAHQHLGGDPDLLEPIDEALLEHVSIDPWPGRCDVAVGLAGYGLYFLTRRDSAIAEASLERIERHLIAAAKSHDEHVWWPPPTWIANHPIELGVAGIGGIASYLASAWPRLGGDARTLLPKALNWLWDHLDPALRTNEESARPAFCEPGVVMAFLRAARRLDSALWWDRGLVVARNLSRLQGVDASLYCGTAGIAHVLHRVYRATGDESFGAAARRWFERLLSMRKPGAGIAGYITRTPDTGELIAFPGLTLGAAGIGLSLLSAWSDIEPGWDAVFGLDLPIVY